MGTIEMGRLRTSLPTVAPSKFLVAEPDPKLEQLGKEGYQFGFNSIARKRGGIEGFGILLYPFEGEQSLCIFQERLLPF